MAIQGTTQQDERVEHYARVALAAAPKPEPTSAVTEEHTLATDILAELVRARAKFPGKNVTLAALVEEVGELATATFEESRERVRKEAVQVAVMAMRMVLDGDHTFDDWRASKGLDPLTAALSQSQAAPQPDDKASGVEGDEDEAYEIGKRDGYEEAVADIDRMTGGDGEYRFCTDHDPDRHCPDVATMKARIVERFDPTTPTEAGVDEPEVVGYLDETITSGGAPYRKLSSSQPIANEPWEPLIRLSDHNTIVERLKQERNELAKDAGELVVAQYATSAVETSLTAEREASARLREALTPSAETKAAYIGEFSISVERHVNDDNEVDDETEGAPDPYEHITVPWTTVKEIMAAIFARAALRELKGGE